MHRNKNVRAWDCPKCETHHDRDVNAAINIRNEGMLIALG
ncbi:transposase [Ruminococcus albus]|nr:transposase [Ruminococcus albus]